MKLGNRSSTAWRTLVMLGILLTAGFAEEKMPSVVLPQLDVTASSEKREAWRYSKLGGWDVYSQISDTRARSLLQSLRKFEFALRIIQPRLLAGQASALTIVLVDEARYRTFAIPDAGIETPEFSTLIHRSGRSAIVVNMSAEFGMGDSAVALITADNSAEEGAATDLNTVDSYRQLDRQYIRHVLAAQSARFPAWLEEGLAQSLLDVEYGGDWVSYGKIETEKNMPSHDQPVPIAIADLLAPNSAVAGLNFKQVFAHRGFMPFEEFFTARRADGSAPSPDSAWAKQAYAFVHFCLFGNKLRYQEPMSKLATRLQTETMSEQLFKDSFGVDYAKMDKELRGYVYHTRHSFQRYPLKPDQRFKPERVEFREATIAEVEQLRRLQP